MKLMIQAIAITGLALLVSCGNSAEKTTTEDTATTTNTVPATDNTFVSIDPPAMAKTNFETKYPQATNTRWSYYRPDMSGIEWDWSGWPAMDDKDYVASFSWDGVDYWSVYDEEGNWIGTVNRISDHASLPAAVNSTIKSKYNGYTIVSVDKENDKDRTAYEVQMENANGKVKVLFDENGKILKNKTVSGDTNTKDKVSVKDSV